MFTRARRSPGRVCRACVYARQAASGKRLRELRATPKIRLTVEEKRTRRQERGRADYLKNVDRYKARAAASVARRKAEVARYQKQWRAENGSRKSMNDKLWRTRNPAKVNMYGNSRRARKLQAMPPWLSNIQLAQLEEFYEVARAVTTQTGVAHDVDHIHPLNGDVFCGLHVPWNLQVMTREENARKGMQLPVGQDLAMGA